MSLLLLLAACATTQPAPIEPVVDPGFAPGALPPRIQIDPGFDPGAFGATVPDAGALRAAAATLGAELTPPEPGPGPEWSPLAEGTRWVPDLWNLDPSEPDPVPVEGFDLLLRRAPWASLAADGTLTLSWETRMPTPMGRIYLGARVEEDPLMGPRHRKSRAESLEGSATDHSVDYALPKLVKPVYDVNGVLARGYGEVDWRVEVFHPDSGTTRLYDGRTAFAVDGDTWSPLPTVVLGPNLDLLTDEGAVISFETDVPTVATVEVGGLPRVSSTEPSTRHELRIDGLAPGRPYTYQVAVADARGASVTPARSFTTRKPDAPVRVAILSDSRSGAAPGLEAHLGVNAQVLSELFQDAARSGVEAIFFPGDLIDGYTTSADSFDLQLRSWHQATGPVHGSVPVYTGMGNHEALCDSWTDRVQIDKSGDESAEAHFASLVVNPSGAPGPEAEGAPSYDETVYRWVIGDVHFVMLNTNYWWTSHPGHERLDGRGNREGFLMDGQLDWLQTQLAQAREEGAAHIVVMGHEPAFPAGGHAEDGMWWNGEIDEVNRMRERFWSLLSEHQVLAYVTGDEHNYSRALIGSETVPGATTPVWSIISGGAGAPYYAQDTPEAYRDRVQAFSTQQHWLSWTFEGERAVLEVHGRTGEIIETVELSRR